MKKENKFAAFIKKYGAYCMAGILVVAIAVTVVIASSDLESTNANLSPAENPIVSVSAPPALTFSVPMLNAEIVKEFSADGLYFNKTRGQWEYHGGVDLISDDMAVFSAADGKVSAVYSNYGDGQVVVITHSNNFKSVYSSLDADSLLVEVGDNVKHGDRIGTASDTANYEQLDGTHLHFELLQNDQKIDPSNYLEFENK
ncbi:MAG: M23 family metallopeptidase [Clostridia bacterium]|nr:M23 family metallopeptidase [Clostridia bacterium]MDD3862889.1 M23 family metallopeptidase [Clostridia bacterium]MDD4408659.1 M23 family metallopeptidase [Clostridia bacterium]